MVYNLFDLKNDTSRFQMLQDARKDLIGELDAIIEYDNHYMMATDQVIKSTWQNIRDEETTHVGELLALINYIDPSQKQFVEDGFKEFNERLNSIKNK